MSNHTMAKDNNRYAALEQDQTDTTTSESSETPSSQAQQNTIAEHPRAKCVPGPGEHVLQYTYSVWFAKKPQGAQRSAVNYEQSIKLVGSFCTVEQFWHLYSYMNRPNDLGNNVDIHVFKDGIRPMWEDDANKHGGKWIVRLRKGLAARCWENVIMAMLGEQFMVGDEMCGAVLSVRYQEDIISVWNRTSSDTGITNRIRDTMSRACTLPTNTIMEYKAHTHSLRDNSSYRNTDVFVR
ncbi:eukaryotic translation initiation factor 4E type 2-like [Sycon ciliatum]|uniref:eukaryotic translation initiation factor 4E type 2-like n=1 Tax=Sycon ciliatum TaxID=27933 RepID=UPI0020AE027E|eukprot:scpid88821/ scgid11677/ Eukaryotic translation initiation factor 4E type 2; Eukaryotic translation initiation factor 4E homologous protein; Eukaryotic translation initiation factor 4E-like 3; eIF4E-like protein 4E-LP; mRNA cap-binding protein 4EHP; mRNA cap-binding protein type 3